MSNQEQLEKDEQLFLSILQNEGYIEGFMDSFFNFLCRRTDYCCITKKKTQKYGFPKEKVIIFVDILILYQYSVNFIINKL